MGENSHRVGENSRNLEFRRDFSCPEVIHIEQILGNYQNYAHEMA
jgi:hypothetical protein